MNANGFATLDWIALGAYFALLLASGVWFARRTQRTTEDYFLGGRRMPVWAVAVSIVATSLSAASFIGVPEAGFRSDLTYLTTNLGLVIAAVIIAVFFIPAFYRSRVQTVYELLGRRFGQPATVATSAAYLVGRVMASGARVYIGAIPASLVLFGDTQPLHLLGAIAVVSAVGIAYTFVGGVASVIWTDAIQMLVFVGACALAVVLIRADIPASNADIIAAWSTGAPDGGSKLRLFDLSPDPSRQFTLLASLVGFTLLGLASYGADQDLVQRMLTCKDAKRGSWSVISGILLGIPSVALFLLVGLLLWIYYARPDLMGENTPPSVPDDSRQVFLRYIIDRLPPGVTGVMMAGLFAAALSSLNSTINAMSGAFINDLYRRIVPRRDERHYLRAGRAAVVATGLVLCAFASFCVFWQRAHDHAGGGGLLGFALNVMVFAYAGIAAVFVTALFTRRGSNASVIAALITGFIVVLIVQPNAMNLWTAWTTWARPLAGVSLAFPWQLTLGFAAAFAVCLLGRAHPASRDRGGAVPTSPNEPKP